MIFLKKLNQLKKDLSQDEFRIQFNVGIGKIPKEQILNEKTFFLNL